MDDDTPQPEPHPEGAAIASAAAFMIFAILASAAAGVVREMVYAAKFGAGASMSAFTQAFRVPDLVYFLIAGGALRTGFIPVFAGYWEKGEHDKAWRTFQAVFGAVILVGLGIVALGMLLSGPLAQLVAGGKKLPAEEVRSCAKFMRIMFPAQVFFAAGGLLAGVQNARRRFFWPGIGPVVYNLVLIFAALLFADIYGLTSQSAAVVVGAFVASFLLQLLALARYGRHILPRIDFRDEGLRQMLLLVGPVILGLSIPEVNKIIVNRFALDVTAAGSGILYYTDHLGTLTVRAFGAGIAIATYPFLSALAARGELDEFKQRLSEGLRHVVFLSLPAVVLIVVLREPIIHLLFLRGKFTPEHAAAVSSTLIWYSLGVVPFAMLAVAARAFYAFKDMRTPVICAALAVATSIVAVLALKGPFGLEGCALAWALAPIVNVALLLIVLRRRMGPLGGRRLLSTALTTAGLSATMGLLAHLTLTVAAGRYDYHAQDTAARAVCLAVPALVGLGSFAALSYVLRVEEARTALNVLLRRVRRAS
ncbi:MAG: murein biosynthesis integral membrane protein MurJ [Armatimonadota bacterium]